MLLALLISRNIAVAAPDELLVLTGRRRIVRDPESGEHRVVGHRWISGGSAFRLPIIERADRLSLAEMSMRLAVPGVVDREGRRWNVELLVNARVAPTEPGVEHAIERFLGMSHAEVKSIVENTVEARVRNALVSYDLAEPSIWNRLERELLEAIVSDADRLGIQVDNLIFEGPPLPALPGERGNGSPRLNGEG